MSEKHLTLAQEAEIARLKEQWLAEAEPYLNAPPQNGAILDGPNSTALARIQKKYLPQLKEIVKASD